MSQEKFDLEKENARLHELTQRDGLTGIYNRYTTEKKINELIENNKTGTLFVLDGNYLKQVNDRYGHITGDSLLQEMARALSYMIMPNDILGRVGGDEFVIYMSGTHTSAFTIEKSRQLSERLQEIRLDTVKSARISATIGVSAYQDGDDYSSMFDRADQCLITAKRSRKEGKQSTAHLEKQESVNKGIDIDMKRISNDLKEQELMPGAFCQDYELFKGIYRFMERRLKRTKGDAYLILLTLTDINGDFPLLGEREKQMEELSDIIQSSLRLGDVFTQYSSCQFLLMVPDAAAPEADLIAMRIHELFFNRNQNVQNNLLLHHCYPLKPRKS